MLTDKEIDALIEREQYYIFPGTTTTVCCLTLMNGFTVIGKSACINKDDFNAEKGGAIAYQKARQQIFDLEAYRLMTD